MPKPLSESQFKNIVGPKIKQLRRRRRVSQRALAHGVQLLGLDIDKNVITRIETGQRYVADFEVQIIAKFFEVDYCCLLDGTGLDDDA